ncbi:hypothetical protein [Paenibacillus brevis]|uniref:DUF5668 domain-containing protein n=1 Tax=Paenibacillus brevis TaxID=2841508 RepID=A0ABS6FWY9_9BACL|nr:hypothetical protein [Paenibacillus brevis]MBU5674739.1 hypothetical protein [Paenibacillus brevis]
MSDNNKLTTGILILAAGIIILLGKLGVFGFLGRAFWPLLLLIPGLLLHLLYFWRKGPAELLVPGAMLVLYSIMFFIAIIWGWQTMKHIWPGFILGIAAGLYEYLLLSGTRHNGLWIVTLILTAVSLILFGFTLFSMAFIYLLAVLMIVAGIWLIAARGRRNTRRSW